jgi:hypothetical protein
LGFIWLELFGDFFGEMGWVFKLEEIFEFGLVDFLNFLDG